MRARGTFADSNLALATPEEIGERHSKVNDAGADASTVSYPVSAPSLAGRASTENLAITPRV